MRVVGQIVSGQYGEVLIRQKSDEELELGELLVVDSKQPTVSGSQSAALGPQETQDLGRKTIMQVVNLQYGSQIQSGSLQLMSGMQLEGYGADLGFMEEKLRNYVLAEVKEVVTVSNGRARTPKALPPFFSEIRQIEKNDLDFLTQPQDSLYVGDVRSGSKKLGIPVFLRGKDVFSHHILIPATTGRGKSNLVRVMLWDVLDKDYCGLLVMDPHNEYYEGMDGAGLRDHPRAADKMAYYSLKPPPGGRTLIVNIKDLKPWFFKGVLDLSAAQEDAFTYFHKVYKDEWIEKILTLPPEDYPKGIHESTGGVLVRKLNLLGISALDGIVSCSGLFSTTAGETTLDGIVSELEKGKTVIVDTSSFSGEIEILISSMISSKLLDRYKHYKDAGELRAKPIVSIVLEEAPRVLGKEVLKSGPNIFSTIAREGRKFKVGLLAITQLPSLIPREVLANINTKIILGLEMEPERSAIIESASQDLSKDGRNIASLDKGEALVTSNFTKFAIPVSIPLFDANYVQRFKEIGDSKPDLSGFS